MIERSRLLKFIKKMANTEIRGSWKPRYFDIGVNFSDSMFQGQYNGRTEPKHPPDLPQVIQRARQFNVKRMLITSSTIKESEEHIEFCKNYRNEFYSTVGVHPCTVAQEFYKWSPEKQEYTDDLVEDVNEKLEAIKILVEKGVSGDSVKAFGEIGLDYDRLHYSNKNQQREMFAKQLDIIASLRHLELPLFLHVRNAFDDFIEIIKPYIDRGDIRSGNGVVHSFTGTKHDLDKLFDLGFFIGVNGCSLKTEENLQVVLQIPIDKLMIETDAPWCEIRKSHAGYKFLEPYPNLFYPQLDVSNPNDEAIPVGAINSSIKLDELLPYPSIKKERFSTHVQAIDNIRTKIEGNVCVDSGIFASPLIKSRNEPVFVGLIAEILCNIHGIKKDSDIENFLDTIYENSIKLFNV